MKVDHDGRISAATETIRRFGLTSLEPAAQACAALRADEPIDVAVLGQFKSGKSSLLNSLLGQAVFPVGVVPVTSVITRAVAGPTRIAHVTHLDGTVEEVPAERLAEFVTEAGNPANRRQVAVVDVVCPAMREWPGLRLVDTPGLGSMFGHNSEATRAWMPHVAVALVTISAERLSGNLDPVIVLRDAADRPLPDGMNDDADATTQDARLTYTLPADGTYSIAVTRYGVRNGTTTGDFRVR